MRHACAEPFVRTLMACHCVALVAFSLPAVLENQHSGFLTVLYVYGGLSGVLAAWPTKLHLTRWLAFAGLMSCVFLLLFSAGVGHPRGMSDAQRDARDYALISCIVMALCAVPSAGYRYSMHVHDNPEVPHASLVINV